MKNIRHHAWLLVLCASLAVLPPSLAAEATQTRQTNINTHSGVSFESDAASQQASVAQPEKVDESEGGGFFEWLQQLRITGDDEAEEQQPAEAAATSSAPNAEVVVDDQLVQEAIRQANPVQGVSAWASPASSKISGQDLEIVRLETYLNSLTTIVADFSQIGPDGSLSTGKFYLKRPGKMRWEYDAPTPVLMVTNGSTLIYFDRELEQVSHIPIDSTLASLLAREHVNLKDPKLTIDSLTRGAGVVRITLSQKNKPEEGNVRLEFTDQPLRIRNMVVKDAGGQVTTISLSKAQFGKPLEKSLFVWVDPRKRRKL